MIIVLSHHHDGIPSHAKSCQAMPSHANLISCRVMPVPQCRDMPRHHHDAESYRVMPSHSESCQVMPAIMPTSSTTVRWALTVSIWKVALYDIIHDIMSLWYWLWYHMFWTVYDIIFLWYHMSMISCFISMISYFSNYDISNFWYHRSMIS